MIITVTKSFTKKQNIKHHILNASKGERVKGDYLFSTLIVCTAE